MRVRRTELRRLSGPFETGVIPLTYLNPISWIDSKSTSQVETISVHHLGPGFDEVVDELLL
jgi:hypothetical protein